VTDADIRDRRLPAELPVETLTAETGDFTSLSTGDINNTVVKATDDSLESAISQAIANGHGTVEITPGQHDLTATDSLPITIDSDAVSILGNGSGAANIFDSSNPPNGTQLLAGGARAIEVSAGSRLNNLNFVGFSLKGELHVPSNQTVTYSRFEDLIFYEADSTADSGRGLNIESGGNKFFNNDIEWVGGGGNDGATIWLQGIAQSHVRHIFSYGSGTVVDGTQIFASPETTTIEKPYTSEAAGVDGITISNFFNSEIYGGYVEKAANGLVVRGTEGGGKGLRIRDGRYVPGANGGQAISVGAQGSGNTQKGIEIGGMQVDGDVGDIEIGSDAWYNLIRAVGKTGGNKWWEGVDFTFNGFQNYLEPLFYSRNDGSVDTSTINVPFQAVEIDDGANTSSGNPGLAVHDNGNWYYMN